MKQYVKYFIIINYKKPIYLFKECVRNIGNGNCTVYLSYNSTNTIPISISQGINNVITGYPQIQPTIFYPGYNSKVLNVTINCTIGSTEDIMWNVTSGA